MNCPKLLASMIAAALVISFVGGCGAGMPVPLTSTSTPVPPTSTSTPVPPTSTSTPVPSTSTSTPVPPTSTSTPVPPTVQPAPNASASLSGSGALYICGGDPPYLGEEPYGVGQFYLYGDGPKDFKYTLAGDIQGSSYTFDLWLASVATTSFDASIVVEQGGKETVLASTSFTAKDQTYQQFSSTVTGLDPTTAKGDTLILRITASSAMQAGSLKPGGLAYGSDMASSIKIPSVKP